jgi:hypothetical protein
LTSVVPYFLIFASISFVRGTHTPRIAHSARWGWRISFVWASRRGDSRFPLSSVVYILLRSEGTINENKSINHILHSTLATRELSSSCSNPPSSANHRCADAHATLHSSLSFPTPFTPPHGLPPLVVQLGESIYPASSPPRASVAIREAADHSTERRTSTRVRLLVEQNSYRSRSHSVTYVRHPSSYYPAYCACYSPPKHHVV